MKQGVSKMKNVFMSILVLFMLAFSMLGNVNLVKADEIQDLNMEITVTPSNIIIDAVESVDVSLLISNTGENPITVDIETTIPRKDNLYFLEVEGGVDREQDFLLPVDNPQLVEFTITYPNDKPIGKYTGTVTITELDVNGDPTANTFTKDYSIIVDPLNRGISASDGLNADSEFEIISEEDNTVAKELTLKNSGNVNLNGLSFKVSGVFTDDTETIGLKVRFTNDANALYQDVIIDQPILIQNALAPQATLPVSIQAHVPDGINLNTYTGNIIILDGNNNNQPILTVPLVLKIEPEVCSDGVIGNLKMDITDPDKGDDFYIGDEIPISVEVENKDNKDLDVIVEAILYDLDSAKKIDSIESDSIGIDKSTAEDFDLTMTVPNDEDIDPDHTYKLYIKASEDGDENVNCNYESIDINLKREDDDVRITTFTITPSVVSHGGTASFSILVENVGKDDQKDVTIRLRSTELGMDLTSIPFTVKKYDKSDNDRVETFTFVVPTDKEAKDYVIEAIVYDKSGRQFDNGYKVGTLTVQGESIEQPPENPPINPPGTYEPITGRSIFDNLGDTKTLFIIGDIVLVILAVLFLILIFRKR